MADDQVQVQIIASVEGLLAGLKDGSLGVQDAAKVMRESLLMVGQSSDQAGEHTETFVQRLRHLRQEAFLGNFMAKEIGELGIASKAAAGELTGLVAAFAMGSGLGVAVAGVKLLVKAIHEVGEETDKQVEAVHKLGAETFRSLSEAMEKVKEKFQATQLTATQLAWNAQMEESKKKLETINEKIAELVSKKGGMGDTFSAIIGWVHQAYIEGFAKPVETSIDKELASFQAQAGAVVASMELARPQKGEAGLTELADKQLKQETAFANEMLKARTALATGTEQINLQYEARVQEIHERYAKEKDKADALLALASEERQKRLMDAAMKTDEEIAKSHKKQEMELLKLQAEELQEDKKHYDKVYEEELKKLQLIDKAWRESAKEQIAAAKEFGAAFGDVFAGIADGTKTVQQAFVDMAKAAVKALFELAIKSVEASAVKAGGEAAAATAGIPIVGPALAIGAMAAMESAVLALLSQLPSAAGGWVLPSDGLLMGHEGEHMIPATLAAAYQKGADLLAGSLGAGDGGGGGGSGVTVVVQVSAIDGDSVRRFVESTDFSDAMREARRNGRLV